MELPDVCLERVLSFLPAYPAVWRCRRVSKQFRRCGALSAHVCVLSLAPCVTDVLLAARGGKQWKALT